MKSNAHNVWGWLSLLVGLSGCSMSRFAFTPCEANSDCREAFGWGNVCKNLLCEPVAPLARCAETWPPSLYQRREEFRDAVVLGVQFDRTEFQLETYAAELAFQQVMKSNGLDDKQMALVECTIEEDPAFDDLTKEEANEQVAVYLADEIGVPAIVGPATSFEVEKAFLAVKPYGTLIMSPTATGIALTELDGSESTDLDPGLLWRTAPPDTFQGLVMADYLSSESIKTVDLIFEEGPYGTALALAFDEAFRERGGTASQKGFEAGDVTMRDSQIAKAATSGRNAVVFISSDKESDIVTFLNEVASQSGLDGDRQIFLADGGADLKNFNNAGLLTTADLERIRIFGPSPLQGVVFDTFASAFSSRFNEDVRGTPYPAFSYDAAWLTLFGTAWSYYREGRISGIGIARGLRQVSTAMSEDPISINSDVWIWIEERFRDGDGVNVRGASGELDFDPATGETVTSFSVWRVVEEEDPEDPDETVLEFEEVTTYSDPTELE